MTRKTSDEPCCGWCSYEEADGSLVERCAACEDLYRRKLPFAVATGRRSGVLTNDRSGIAKLLIVGEAPVKKGRKLLPALHPDGRTGARLLKLMGADYDWAGISAVAATLNLYPRQARFGWNAQVKAEARDRAVVIRDYLCTLGVTTRVLLLGRRVASAFGFGGPWVDPFRWTEPDGGPSFSLIPHPSGRSRWWNDGRNEEQARAFLSALWKEIR